MTVFRHKWFRSQDAIDCGLSMRLIASFVLPREKWRVALCISVSIYFDVYLATPERILCRHSMAEQRSFQLEIRQGAERGRALYVFQLRNGISPFTSDTPIDTTENETCPACSLERVYGLQGKSQPRGNVTHPKNVGFNGTQSSMQRVNFFCGTSLRGGEISP